MTRIFHYALFMVVSLFAVSANGAPMAYSVNSDSGNEATEDSLYLIDLFTGIDEQRGKLTTGIEEFDPFDTEGMAFAPNGVLWGIDESRQKLFPINTEFGTINFNDMKSLTGFPKESNDFGMTFSCDNSLYVTSVTTRTLYQLDLEGNSEAIGALGTLGVEISAIAAIGSDPTLLYGIQNGDVVSPNLYSINVTTGVAIPIGPLGNEVGEFNQAGLAFDSEGTLWAITDRRGINDSLEGLVSQIFSINVESGNATLVSSTINEVGFESLAIGPPMACEAQQVKEDGYIRIPTLNTVGRLLSIFLLMFAGMLILRRRSS